VKRHFRGISWLAVLLVAALVAGGCVGPLGGSAPPTPESTATPTIAATATFTPAASPTPTFTVTTATPIPTPAPSPTPRPSPSPTASVTPTPLPTVTPVPSGQRALQHVRHLAETIGSRPAGTPQERDAADYIEAQFRSFGYSVTRQGFSFPYFVDRGSSLQVTGPQQEELHPLTMGLSAAGRVEAPLTAAGLARPQDLPREGLRGRIALVQRGDITFDEKVAAAATAGAAGAVIYNNAPGNFRGRLGQIASIPVISVSQEEGGRLLELLGKVPVTVRVSVDATSQDRRGENIIATRPGTRPETVIFGAHYDSVEAGPGANDNASGTAAVLELARTAPAGPLTLRFITFSAEELGLLGSRHYVSTLSQQERQQIVAMVSLDMVGVGDRMRFGGSQQLVQTALAIAREQGSEALALEGSAAGASDHASFISAGIPGILFFYTVGNDIDPRYHSAQDRVSFVDAADIEKMVRLGLSFAYRLMCSVVTGCA